MSLARAPGKLGVSPEESRGFQPAKSDFPAGKVKEPVSADSDSDSAFLSTRWNVFTFWKNAQSMLSAARRMRSAIVVLLISFIFQVALREALNALFSVPISIDVPHWGDTKGSGTSVSFKHPLRPRAVELNLQIIPWCTHLVHSPNACMFFLEFPRILINFASEKYN